MEKIAGVLGKKEDILKYSNKNSVLKKLVHQTFFDPAKNIYADGYQIDLAFPLLAGVTPDALIQPVKKSLDKEIEQNRKGHIACGLVGVPVFTEWAIQNKSTDLVYSMLKKKDYPGYLYMIENGATTTWEEWKNPRSYIHNCYNGIGSWFYQALGGIRPDIEFAGYKRVIIQPQVPSGITWANTTKETPYGTLAVNWKLRANELDLNLQIPVGVTAKVIIPDRTLDYILNRKQFQVKMDQNSIEISSGKYELSYSYKTK
jgi:alpha-L-rhamnosidase